MAKKELKKALKKASLPRRVFFFGPVGCAVCASNTDGRKRLGKWSPTGSCNATSISLDGAKALTGVRAGGRSQSRKKDWNWI